ncbi:MAG: rhomboid family intramembrane serine protease [Chitinophagales bacterium]|nr:rhomboid family intramembrane serine protease [Chitinophagales bacterium]
MYNDNSIWQEIKYKYQYGGAHVKLIMINVVVFVVLNILLFFANPIFHEAGRQFVMDLFMGSSNSKEILLRPWTVFTNIFTHVGFFHLLFNMLFLYVFGNIVRDLIGNSKLVPIYFLSGLFGYALFVLAYNLFPFYKTIGGSHILGASGAIMGITFAAVAVAPNYEVRLLLLGNVKIKWIALFYLFWDTLSLQGSNAGGSIAHLGGALIGFMYIKQLQRGVDWARPFYWLEDWWTNLRKSKKKKVRVVFRKFDTKGERVHVEKKAMNKEKVTTYTTRSQNKQEKLDDILDKINVSGYDSLSDEEKTFLFKISQED